MSAFGRPAASNFILAGGALLVASGPEYAGPESISHTPLAAVLPAPSAYRLDHPSARLQRRADWIADQTQRIGGRRYLDRL